MKTDSKQKKTLIRQQRRTAEFSKTHGEENRHRLTQKKAIPVQLDALAWRVEQDQLSNDLEGLVGGSQSSISGGQAAYHKPGAGSGSHPLTSREKYREKKQPGGGEKEL